tara:strand:- start:121 stop:783 length:663 start_codon:yes stop_codon:yes gene_type:complete
MKKYFNHVEIPDLPNLTRTTINGKRHYTTPSGELISITSLLSSKTPQGILDWRESVGESVANYIMRTAANRGTKVHKLVELTLSNTETFGEITEFGVLPVGLFNLMTPTLENIDNIRVLEKPLFSEKLRVAGTVDCIAEYHSELAVLDFKTASRIRSKEDITNYFLQCTFYSQAWFEMTGEQIKKIVIIMASEDGHLEIFEEETANYIEQLKHTVEEFFA